MSTVGECDARIAALRQLGLSEAALRLASGELLHPGLCECGSLPPEVEEPLFHLHGQRTYYRCHRRLPSCDDPPLPTEVSWFIPMWTFRGGITGVWEREGGLEFVDYCIDRPDDGFEFVARTEQGLLAYILVGVEDEWLDAVANAVGFHFLDLYRAALASGELPSEKGLKRVVACIDIISEPIKSGRAEPGAAADRPRE